MILLSSRDNLASPHYLSTPSPCTISLHFFSALPQKKSWHVITCCPTHKIINSYDQKNLLRERLNSTFVVMDKALTVHYIHSFIFSLFAPIFFLRSFLSSFLYSFVDFFVDSSLIITISGEIITTFLNMSFLCFLYLFLWELFCL